MTVNRLLFRFVESLLINADDIATVTVTLVFAIADSISHLRPTVILIYHDSPRPSSCEFTSFYITGIKVESHKSVSNQHLSS